MRSWLQKKALRRLSIAYGCRGDNITGSIIQGGQRNREREPKMNLHPKSHSFGAFPHPFFLRDSPTMHSAPLLAGQPISWPKPSDKLTPFECFDFSVD